MVGQMPLRKMWTITFTTTCLALVAVFFLGCENAKKSCPQIDHSHIRLAISFPQWSRDQSKSQVVLTFSNPTAHTETVVLPVPLNENATSFGSPEKPILALIAREQITSNETGFTMTDLSNRTSGHAETLTLKSGESAEIPYSLASFYSWGHAGPTETMGFLTCLPPGKHDVAVRAIVAYSDVEPEEGDHIASSSVVLKCDFPKWLFTAKGEQSSGTTEDAHKQKP